MRAASEPYGAIEVVAVPALYPMGSAKQLIRQVTGREVPAGGRSTDVGVLVHNAGTVYAIQQALRHGRPLISRVVTVAGGCVSNPRNIETLIGTPVQALFESCGGLLREPQQLLLGGPMMGMLLPSTAVPVIKERHRAAGARPRRSAAQRQRAVHPLRALRRRLSDGPGSAGDGRAHPRRRFRRRQRIRPARLHPLWLLRLYVCPRTFPWCSTSSTPSASDERRSAARKNDYVKQLAEARAARLAEEEAAKAAAKAAKKRKRRRRPPARYRHERAGYRGGAVRP